MSGLYLSSLSSGPKIVQVISLILAILLQCYCPSPPCKHDHKLFRPLWYCGCIIFFISPQQQTWPCYGKQLSIMLHYALLQFHCKGVQYKDKYLVVVMHPATCAMGKMNCMIYACVHVGQDCLGILSSNGCECFNKIGHFQALASNQNTQTCYTYFFTTDTFHYFQ